MNHAELAFPAVILLAVSALLTAGFLVLDYSWTVITFPFVTGIVLGVLCLLQLATTVRKPLPTPAADERPDEPLIASSIAWILALAVLLYGVGFIFGPAIFLLAYSKAQGSSWKFSSALSASSLIVTWVLFVKLLGVLLPAGPLWLS
jgi:hypothetical protein